MFSERDGKCVGVNAVWKYKIQSDECSLIWQYHRESKVPYINRMFAREWQLMRFCWYSDMKKLMPMTKYVDQFKFSWSELYIIFIAKLVFVCSQFSQICEYKTLNLTVDILYIIRQLSTQYRFIYFFRLWHELDKIFQDVWKSFYDISLSNTIFR